MIPGLGVVVTASVVDIILMVVAFLVFLAIPVSVIVLVLALAYWLYKRSQKK